MGSVNKVILVGNLGKDPEVRYAPSGNAVANFTLATNEQFKDRDGNKQERTEWHRVVFWGRQAEVVGEYLRKGGMCYVEGRLQTRKWTDKDGQERYTTEIVGDRLQLLGSGARGGSAPMDDLGNDHNSLEAPSSNARRPAPVGAEEFEDDIPF